MRLLTLTSLLATAVLATARSLPPSNAFGNNGQGGHGDSSANTQVAETTAAATLSTAAENVAAKSTATAKTTTLKTSSTKKTSTSTSSVAAVASSSSSSGSSSGTSRTTAPDGALTVGSSGTYSTIQDAVDALDTSTTTAQSIFIESGTYSEQVTIPELASALSIYGYTEDTSSYSSNVVSIEHSYSLDDGAADDKSTGTLINLSANTAIYNIDIKNIYGEGSQAIALSAYNSEQGYYGVGLYGYQDTLLAETGTQFYGNCYIEGAVDFIFGQEANIWIEGSTIAVSAGGGSITANGRVDADGDSYYVINNSEIAASSSGSVTASSVYLGRPWSEYARVAFQNSQLSDIINSAGWAVWNTGDERTDDVTFETYANTGDGATDCCTASFATELSAAIDITTILGSDYADWVDADYYS